MLYWLTNQKSLFCPKYVLLSSEISAITALGEIAVFSNFYLDFVQIFSNLPTFYFVHFKFLDKEWTKWTKFAKSGRCPTPNKKDNIAFSDSNMFCLFLVKYNYCFT